MIAQKDRINFESTRSQSDYQDGYTDGFLDASRITDSDAFFEIGIGVLCLVIGVFFGWAVSGL
jgi:hypothetical protein